VGYVDVPIVNGFVADAAKSKLQRKKSMINTNPGDMADRDQDGMKSNAYIAGLFTLEASINQKIWFKKPNFADLSVRKKLSKRQFCSGNFSKEKIVEKTILFRKL